MTANEQISANEIACAKLVSDRMCAVNRVVYDIETVGEEFRNLDEQQQEYFVRFATTPEDQERAKTQTAFYALTGKIVAIAMVNPDTEHARVYGIGDADDESEDDVELLFVNDEATLLRRFWEDADHYQQFVTFNGRSFDAPFILLRSAINRVKPTMDIMGYRYKSIPHLDLTDQFSFFGATRRHFPLHFYCKAFGIESPKEEMSGLDVPRYFQEGRVKDIAEYCLGDAIATAELLEYWDDFLSPDVIES